MQVGWIDFSFKERERTLTVLGSLQKPGSIDELGVGIVRDAFAARLFPGTSTLFTKARYFFLTAYLMKGIEQEHDAKRREPRSLRSEYRDLERRCAEGLLSRLGNTAGIVGKVSLSNGKWVSRGPGEIYWASLRTLGFTKPGSPESYAGYFSYASNARIRFLDSLSESSEGGTNDDGEPVESVWNIPRECWNAWSDQWTDWKRYASIDLTEQEAVFLKTQIIKERPKSLFALLLEDDELRSVAIASCQASGDDSIGSSDSAFHTFVERAGVGRIGLRSTELARLCQIADGFSEFVFGCRIAYNMQLVGLEDAGGAAWGEFAPRAAQVAKEFDIDETWSALGLVDHGGFLSLREFSLRAKSAMMDGDVDSLKEVVAAREKDIKVERAKIGRTDLGDLGWRGGKRLSYRFNQAVSIIREIDQAGGFDA